MMDDGHMRAGDSFADDVAGLNEPRHIPAGILIAGTERARECVHDDPGARHAAGFLGLLDGRGYVLSVLDPGREIHSPAHDEQGNVADVVTLAKGEHPTPGQVFAFGRDVDHEPLLDLPAVPLLPGCDVTGRVGYDDALARSRLAGKQGELVHAEHALDEGLLRH